MEHRTVTLNRHAGPDWIFAWDARFNGLIYRTSQNIYKLFFEDIATSYKPIWIGRLTHDQTSWYTAEKEINAESIILLGCTIVFD